MLRWTPQRRLRWRISHSACNRKRRQVEWGERERGGEGRRRGDGFWMAVAMYPLAPMAQWLEHRSCKAGVGSSNLSGGTSATILDREIRENLLQTHRNSWDGFHEIATVRAWTLVLTPILYPTNSLKIRRNSLQFIEVPKRYTSKCKPVSP